MSFLGAGVCTTNFVPTSTCRSGADKKRLSVALADSDNARLNIDSSAALLFDKNDRLVNDSSTAGASSNTVRVVTESSVSLTATIMRVLGFTRALSWRPSTLNVL